MFAIDISDPFSNGWIFGLVCVLIIVDALIYTAVMEYLDSVNDVEDEYISFIADQEAEYAMRQAAVLYIQDRDDVYAALALRMRDDV